MTRLAKAVLLGVVFLLVASGSLAAQSGPIPWGEPFDVLITGGRVLDGTGNPWFYADVGIRNGVIEAVGALAGASAARVIDAEGKFLTPGFVDIHSHAEGQITDTDARRRAAPNLVFQGITTVVINSCGRSHWPLREQREQLEALGMGPNVILQVGHGTVRGRVLGEDYRREATPGEVEAMKALVREAMAEGAWGLSAGLEYAPGRWSTTDEVVALTEEVVPYGGTYMVHLRSQAADPRWFLPAIHEAGEPTLLDAVRETIEIGERTGATVVNSHIKARGLHYWGSSGAAIELIRRARERGVSVWADAYSYNTTGSDGRIVLIPGWILGLDPHHEGNIRGREGGDDYAAALRRALAEDPGALERLRMDVQHEVSRRGGPDSIIVMDHPDPGLVGKTLADLGEAWGASLLEVALRLQYEGYTHRHTGARLRGHSMSELDVENFFAQPWVATASDAGVWLLEDGPDVNPRFYGTFPRRIREYGLNRGVTTVEDAVRSMSSLPAQILGLRDRGRIAEGYRADLVIMDLGRLKDRASIFEPTQYPEGIEYVLVNGEFVVERGALTWALPGRVLVPERSNARYAASSR